MLTFPMKKILHYCFGKTKGKARINYFKYNYPIISQLLLRKSKEIHNYISCKKKMVHLCSIQTPKEIMFLGLPFGSMGLVREKEMEKMRV